MNKTTFAATAAATAVVALLAGTYLATRDAGPDCGAGVVAGGNLGGPFTLIDETGATVTDADVIAGPTLIYFGYTFCPDVCPLDALRNGTAVDVLAERGIAVNSAFITIDPARDTPEVVSAYTDNFHPNMLGLTGSDAQIAEAAKAYRVFYSRADDDPEYYLMNHSVFTYLVTPDEGFVDVFRREDSPEQMADKVTCLLADV